MSNAALIAALETALALARGEAVAGPVVASPVPAPTLEGQLAPELLAIKFWHPGTDYAGRPTQIAPARSPAVPSQLDEIGDYTVYNWTKQTPPVSFMDYLLMLHDLMPALTDKQRFNILAGRWSAASEIPNVDMKKATYLELATRWLFPERFQTEADKAATAQAAVDWDAHWAGKGKPLPAPAVPVVGTE